MKFLCPKSDTLSKISIKKVFRIHFLRRTSFLRKHRKDNFDLYTVYFNIFFWKLVSQQEIVFLKSILLENVMRCNFVKSELDTLKKSPFRRRRFLKTLVGRLIRNENFGSKTVSYSSLFFLRFIVFKEALCCHPWSFYRQLLQKFFFQKQILQQNLIF